VRCCLSQLTFSLAARLFSCLTIAVSGKFLLVCFLPVIGWAVWCLKKKKQQHEVDGTEMQVHLIVYSSLSSFATLVASSDYHVQTYRPPSTASSAWNSYLSQQFPQLPLPLPQLALAGHYQHAGYGASGIQHPSAPPLSDSLQMYETRNPHGSAVLAIPGGAIASV
jgi:hypothetical protein